MKKRILGLILAVIACLTLCIPAIAAEIESDADSLPVYLDIFLTEHLIDKRDRSIFQHPL